MKNLGEMLKKFGKKCNDIMHNTRLTNTVIGFIVVALILLYMVNMVATMKHNDDYAERVKAGNGRWQQVESIITETEQKVIDLQKRVDELNKRVNELENKI